jgi:hypothetical protein
MSEALVAVVGMALIGYLLYRLMRWARGRSRGAEALGAVLTEVTQSAVVHEAKQGRKRKAGQAGDPPQSDTKEVG